MLKVFKGTENRLRKELKPNVHQLGKLTVHSRERERNTLKIAVAAAPETFAADAEPEPTPITMM